jgi:hypothetical protein
MSDQFTPLAIGSLPPAGPSAETGAKSAAPVPAPSPFAALPPASGAASAPEAHDKPQVTLLRNATGVVTGIRVQCSCGRVTELNCVY